MSLFLAALEAGSMKSGGQHGQALGEDPLPGFQVVKHLLIVSLHSKVSGDRREWEGWWWRESSLIFILIKALIPS